ncbi:MAG: hypothetical protein KI788_12260 [Mameliella sp.]|nr:hypothetical protein [Mameliella sp.]
MIYLIPALVALGALGLGWALLRFGMGAASAVLALVLTGAGGWLIYRMQMASEGWDALGYGIGLMLGVLPALVGLGVGALIGLARRHKAEAAAERS